jgi:DNA-directed RNA polymerase specialized sigma subunit
MQELMDPVQFTFGVGLGTISTSFNSNTIAMDGEVFHRARKALEEAKKKKSLLRFEFDHPALSLTNAITELIDKHHCRLSPRQRTIAGLMKQHDNQSRVAKILKVSQPTVWKVISSQHIKQLHEAERSLHSFLSSLIQQDQ